MPLVYGLIGVAVGVAAVTFLDLWLWTKDRRDRRGR